MIGVMKAIFEVEKSTEKSNFSEAFHYNAHEKTFQLSNSRQNWPRSS